jgi:hypothetical protein
VGSLWEMGCDVVGVVVGKYECLMSRIGGCSKFYESWKCLFTPHTSRLCLQKAANLGRVSIREASREC